jgi:hypothetical protein
VMRWRSGGGRRGLTATTPLSVLFSADELTGSDFVFVGGPTCGTLTL